VPYKFRIRKPSHKPGLDPYKKRIWRKVSQKQMDTFTTTMCILRFIIYPKKCQVVIPRARFFYSLYLLLFCLLNYGTKTPCICTYYMFRHIAAIIRQTELLESPFFISAIPPYNGQCLYIGSALYMYVVYVIPLCYNTY
jgi:hypothetical protein